MGTIKRLLMQTSLFLYFFSLAAVFFCSAIVGCAGYQVRKEAPVLRGVQNLGRKHRVYVPVVDNTTLHTGFEGMLTSRLRQALARSEGLEIVNSESQADVILLARVHDYGRTPSEIEVYRGNTASEAVGGLQVDQQTSREFGVSLVMSVQLLERVGDGVLRSIWVRQLSGAGTYTGSNRLTPAAGAGSVGLINASREEFQVMQIADHLAQQVLDQVASEF